MLKRVAIFCAPKENVRKEAHKKIKIIERADFEIVGLHGFQEKEVNPSELCKEADFIIVFGGDGTILYTAKYCGDKPILGVNYGKIGFLTEITPDNFKTALEKIKSNMFWIQENKRLGGEIAYPDGERLALTSVLNEYLVYTSALSKMVSFEIFVDLEPITKVRGDGFIVATPIGSSAYALSAGGPILIPNALAFLVVPLAPLWGKFRSLVLSEKNVLSIKVREDGSNAVIVGDGMDKYELPRGSLVHFRLTNQKTRFIRFGSKFEKLSRLMLII